MTHIGNATLFENSSGTGTISSITGNIGGAVQPDASRNINIIGDVSQGIEITGVAATNTLTVAGINATTIQKGVSALATDAEAIAGVNTTDTLTPSALSAKLGTQTNHGLPIGAGASSALTWTAIPANGELLIGTGAQPTLATLTAGAGIGIVNAAGSITISNTASGAQQTITGNTGGAVGPDGANNITITGNTTQGLTLSGNPVTFSLEVTASDATTTQKGVSALATDAEAIAGVNTTDTLTPSSLAAKLGPQTNHGVLIGSGSSSAISATSAGTTNTVLLGNTGLPPSFGTVPNAALQNSSITLSDGNNITVTGSPVALGGVATIAVTGTTDHAVQVGNASGSLTSLVVGATGTLLVGASGANPAFATSAVGDFTFTSSTAGATRTLTVSNSDNTAANASSAAQAITVGGTTQTGDPYTVYGVGSTRSYAIGPDTSDSQKLKITTANAATVTPSSGTTLFTMDSTGTITLATALPVASGGTGATTLTGVLTGNGTSAFTASPVTQFDVLVGGASNAISSVGPGSAGQVLQSAGNAANPAYSTATYPLTTAQGDLLSSTSANTIVTLAKDTNATRYLSNTGTNNNAAWAQVALGTGVSGQLPLANGGTNANLTASNGGIFYSTSTAGAILAGTATANQVLLSGSNTTPSWSTATYPTTTTVSQLLYSSATNTISGLATANNSLLITGATGIPALGTTLTNDFTATSATAAATRTLTVSNTDNTSVASTAVIAASTGGSSSGDAVHQAIITGVTTWSWGADNSDSDAFVLAASATLGTTNVIRSSTAGEINYPLQPSFFAYNNSNLTNQTGDGTTVNPVVFDSELWDQNADFASNTFTAPVTGKYFFSCGISYSTIAAGHNNLFTKVVSSNRNYQVVFCNPGAMRDSSNSLSTNFSFYADMDAADTIIINTTISGSTKTVGILGVTGTDQRTFFSGQLCV